MFRSKKVGITRSHAEKIQRIDATISPDQTFGGGRSGERDDVAMGVGQLMFLVTNDFSHFSHVGGARSGGHQRIVGESGTVDKAGRGFGVENAGNDSLGHDAPAAIVNDGGGHAVQALDVDGVEETQALQVVVGHLVGGQIAASAFEDVSGVHGEAVKDVVVQEHVCWARVEGVEGCGGARDDFNCAAGGLGNEITVEFVQSAVTGQAIRERLGGALAHQLVVKVPVAENGAGFRGLRATEAVGRILGVVGAVGGARRLPDPRVGCEGR